MIREFTLEGSTIFNLKTFVEQIGQLLTFPDFIEHDISGLYDGLNLYTAMPLKILWNNHSISQKYMRHDYERVISVLKEVQDNHSDFEYYLN